MIIKNGLFMWTKGTTTMISKSFNIVDSPIEPFLQPFTFSFCQRVGVRDRVDDVRISNSPYLLLILEKKEKTQLQVFAPHWAVIKLECASLSDFLINFDSERRQEAAITSD